MADNFAWVVEARTRQDEKQAMYHRWKIFDEEQDGFMRTDIGVFLFAQAELPDGPPPPLNHYYRLYGQAEQNIIENIVAQIRYKIPLPRQVAFGCTVLTAHVDGCEGIREFVVFRCATAALSDVFFIEPSGRVYQNWDDFVGSNKLPYCSYLAPNDGIYKLEGAFRLYTSPEANKGFVRRYVDKVVTVAGVGAIGAGVFAVAPVASAVTGKERVMMTSDVKEQMLEHAPRRNAPPIFEHF